MLAMLAIIVVFMATTGQVLSVGMFFITVVGLAGFGQDAGFIDDGSAKTKTLTMQA